MPGGPGEAAATITAVTTAAAIPAIVFDADTWLAVVIPIIASWFGLVGIGVLAEQSVGQIMRRLLGTIMLGGVVGIAAMAVIAAFGASGIFAALLTLTIAVAPVIVWRSLTGAAPRVIDAALGAVGLERKKGQDDDGSTG